MTKTEMTDEEFITNINNLLAESRKEYRKFAMEFGEVMLKNIETRLKEKEVNDESKRHQ